MEASRQLVYCGVWEGFLSEDKMGKIEKTGHEKRSISFGNHLEILLPLRSGRAIIVNISYQWSS